MTSEELKKQICEMVDKINNVDYLRRILWFIKPKFERSTAQK